VIRLGPPAASCRVLVFRDGLFSALGHDLEIDVTRFDVRVDETRRTADASFDAASLRVVRALRDGVELRGTPSERDRRTIEDTIRRDVLDAPHHPEIRFRTTRVAERDDGFDVTGRLSLHGRDRETRLVLRRVVDRYEAEVRLHQPDFDIRPYAAFLGALRVKADVLVRLTLPAEPPR
jgi:YceI-like protein